MKKILLLLSVCIITILKINLGYANNINTTNKNNKLIIPIDCEYNNNCYIQNYFDIDASSNYQDYKCKKLSYDTHKGVDFRLLDIVQLQNGVNALAAADGKVLRTRNSEQDYLYYYFVNKNQDIKNTNKYNKLENKILNNKECGNGIVISHIINNKEYNTQYCHLKQNSITIKPGDIVKAGDIIGQVGMSGKTEFPHLHISIQETNNNKITHLDPFTGKSASENPICYKQDKFDINNTNNKTFKNSLWSKNTLDKLIYIPTALLNFYLTDNIPDALAARGFADNYNIYRKNKLDKNSDKFVFWTDIMGVYKNDIIKYKLINTENNKIIFTYDDIVKQNYVQYFSYTGKNFDNKDFYLGKYLASIELIRDDIIIFNKQITVTTVSDQTFLQTLI